MKLPRFNSVRTVLGAFLMVVAGLVFQGCSGSTSKAPEEKSAGEIRGAPINSPVAVSTQSVSAAAGAILTNTPNTESAATNAVASSTIKEQAGPQKPADGAAEEFTPVSFERLASFAFEIPDEPQATNKVINASKSESQIPASVKALDQKRVALKGFMLPLKVESGLVTEMLIMRDQSMCCYGTVPKINEWVSIKMAEKGVKAIMDQPVTIFGKLRVGEIRENGYLVGIYQMDGEKMAGPPDL
jgi:hypothetical protein